MVDLELAYRVMAQPDARESDSSLFVAPSLVNRSSRERKVLGVYKTWFERADEPVKKACQRALDYLISKCRYEVVDISIPLIHVSRQPTHTLIRLRYSHIQPRTAN